jgi:tetratricopeptide (TPR) repeat protein
MKNRTETIHIIVAFCCLMSLVSCNHDYVEKGDVCLALGDYRMAIEFYGKRLERAPEDYNARLGLGKALLQKAVDKEGDLEAWDYSLVQLEASRTLKPSREIKKLLCDAYTAKSRLLLSRGDTVAALNSISRAVEYNGKEVEPINLAGIIYFRMGEEHKAEALFKRAVSIDSLHPTAYFNMGMIGWQRGDYTAAHGFWLKTLKIVPDDEDVIYWFARAEKELRSGE